MTTRVSPPEFYDAVVKPALFAQLDQAFPEFHWTRKGRGWQAGREADELCRQFTGGSARRTECRNEWGFFAHGADSCTWIEYISGGQRDLRGARFTECVIRLAERAGVDPSPILPDGGFTAEQHAAWKAQHEKAAAEAAERRVAQAAEQRRRDAEEIDRARALYDAAEFDHPAVAAYYARRLGIESKEVPGRCRFGPSGLPSDSHAILVPVWRYDGDDPELVAVQRLLVDAAGAPDPRAVYEGEDPIRKATKGKPAGGAAMMGAPDGTLLLCEGVETGWALHHATGYAVWACISTSGLMNVEIPEAVLACIDRVVIAADLDRVNPSRDVRPGHDAAERGARRLAELHPLLEVRAVAPGFEDFPDLVDERGDPVGGKSVDWLDVFRAHGARAVKEAVRGAVLLSGDADELSEDNRPTPRNPHKVLPASELERARRCLDDLFAPDPVARANKCRTLLTIDGRHSIYRDGRWTPYATGSGVLRSQVRRWAAPFDQLRHAKTGSKAPYYTQANLSRNAIESVVVAMSDETLVARPEGRHAIRFWREPDYDAEGMPRNLTAFERIQWRPDRHGLPRPEMVVPFKSGLFDMGSWVEQLKPVFIDHTSRFYCETVFPVDLRPSDFEACYDEDASWIDDLEKHARSLCPDWIAMLEDQFGDGDPARAQADIRELHKLGGLYLVPGPTQFGGEIAMLVGPSGSGKSTILTVFREVIGDENCISSTFDKLTDRAHMAAWLGKHVAIFGDASVSNKLDKKRATETLKMLTGGDPQSLRKNYGDEMPSVVLPTRAVFAVNEQPALSDPTGALGRRCVFFGIKKVNKEPNKNLTTGKRLLLQPEALRGVTLLFLIGYLRLVEEGGFHVPPSGRALAAEFRAQTTDYADFVDDCFDIIDAVEGEDLDDVPGLTMLEISRMFEAYCREELGRTESLPLPKTLLNSVCRLLEGRGWRGRWVKGDGTQSKATAITHVKKTVYAGALGTTPMGHREDELPGAG